MAGFIQDPLQFINLIRDNLSDRYKRGFPIIKELIQNTDDAKASRLDFGLCPGISSAAHPLLKGPGLFLINNGEFKESDAEGIRSFGLNSKADESSSIGKFGLGMKSVFHFCEAFFFLARDQHQDFSEVLNPWSGGRPEKSLHKHWEEFRANDVTLIYSHLQKIIDQNQKDTGRVFVLWLPLRQKSHLVVDSGHTGGAIVQEFYGDSSELLSFLDDASLPESISNLVPLLRHLKDVYYWNLNENVDSYIYSSQLQAGFKRLSLLESIAAEDLVIETQNNKLNGEILYGDKQKIKFCGLESYGWNKLLKIMHADALWPCSNVNDEFGIPKIAKDKARPHGAVLLSRTKKKGSFTTRWSVFLPLDDKTNETIYCDGDFAYSLTLHGYFFIDAGRQYIDGWHQLDEKIIDQVPVWESDAKLKCSWNAELARTQVFPLVLQAISDFSSQNSLKISDITILTAAFSQTGLWRKFRHFLTERQCWVMAISQEGTRWILVKNNISFLKIPEPPSNDYERPWQVFPSLSDLSVDNIFIANDAPSLLSANADDQWSKLQLITLLTSIKISQVFVDQKLLSYLETFLSKSDIPELKSLDVQNCLVDLLRKAIIKHGENLNQNRKLFQSIVGCIQSDNIFEINRDIPEKILRSLLEIKISVLLVPRSLKSDISANSPLKEDDAVVLLRKLSELVDLTKDKKDLKELLNVAEQFIDSVPESNRKTLMARCSEFKILSVYDCSQDSERAISLESLKQSLQKGLLFGFSPGIDERKFGLAKLFQAVLPNDNVFLASSLTIKRVLDQRITQCDEVSVLDALARHRYPLGGITERCHLLEKIKVPETQSGVQGLRYLLHANKEHFDFDGSLWLLGNEQNDVWQKLWSVMQPDSTRWNLLDIRVGDVITGAISKKAGIRYIHSSDIIEELSQADEEIELDTSGFSEEECAVVLEAIHDDELWKRMPFHWSVDDKPVSVIRKNVYLNTNNVLLDADLLDSIDLIKPARDSQQLRRQQANIRPLNEAGLINVYLSSPDPAKYSALILDNLLSESEDSISLDFVLRNKLRTTKWLMSHSGLSFSPEDVIDLDGATDELNRILLEVPDVFCLPSSLHENIKNHIFFSRLSSGYFSRSENALARLSLILPMLRNYQLGGLEIADDEMLEMTTRAMKGSSHAGWQLLDVLKGCVGLEICFKSLLPSINNSISIDRQIDLMRWLSSTGKSTSEISIVFNLYLKLFSAERSAASRLPELFLLNMSSEWVSASELASNVEGIAKNHILDKSQKEILHNLLNQGNKVSDLVTTPKNDQLDAVYAPDAAAEILKHYFTKWKDRIADPILSALLIIMGKQPLIRQLADDYLGHHSLDWLIDLFPWKTPEKIRYDEPVWLEGYDINKAIDYFSFSVAVNRDESILLDSITGKQIKVSIEKDFKSVFIGRPSYRRDNNGYLVSLTLHYIDIDEFSDKQLTSLIKESVRWLLREVYNQKVNDLSSLWGELDKSDQVDIELARTLVLDNVPFYLRQLKAHKNNELESRLREYDTVRKQVAEFKNRSEQQKYKQEQSRLLNELQNFVEQNKSAKDGILQAIRTKIRDYQYQDWSIPFEIFQNADDALIDLERIEAWPALPGSVDTDPLPTARCRFVVNITEDQVTFMHWGRAINQVGSGGFPGREYGYDNDLENMVILSASDKDENVTGKFGLGFKSVLLVTDQPELVSGRLQTQIVGGLLPTIWDSTSHLRQMLADNQPGKRWPGTAVNLPLRDSYGTAFMDSFISRAGVLVAFSRKINEIQIFRENGEKSVAQWKPECLINHEQLFTGRLATCERETSLVVKFDLKDGALLLSIGPEGFRSLPDSIPNIWVTAPLSENSNAGFAINAMFEIDAGRSRLAARSEYNVKLGGELGRDLEPLLLVLLTSDWEILKKQLELAEDISRYHLVFSLWKTFLSRLRNIERDSGIRSISDRMLSVAFSDLSRNHDFVPNGLPDEYGRLLKWPDISSVLKGALSHSRLLLAMCQTDYFGSELKMETSITAEVSTWLNMTVHDFASGTVKWVTQDLCVLLDSAGNSSKGVSPEDSRILGEIFHAETEESLLALSHDAVNDFKRAHRYFAEIRFEAADGSWQKARSLISNLKDDEKLRWAFAPLSSRLSDKYSVTGVEFFIFCRPKLDVPAEKLTEWAFAAETDRYKVAALEYLLRGELNMEVRDRILEKGIEGSWLASINEDSELIASWSPGDKVELIYNRLKSSHETARYYRDETDKGAYDSYEKEPLDPEEVLNNIYEWWQENVETELEAYEKSFYPDEIEIDFSEDNLGNYDRSSWLALFMIAHFHTMGRTKINQHSGFIDFCHKKGWWPLFAEKNPDDFSEQWMQILKDFYGAQFDQQSYEQWMNRFGVFYKLSRYLDDYVELLQGLELHQYEFSLENALKPMADPSQQGGGISAPALDKTLGILGSSLVIRELVRKGIIQSKNLHEHAYVPYKGVRRLLSELGCSDMDSEINNSMSSEIHEFISDYLGDEKCTFNNCYDIPLRIIADSWDLQMKLLGRELSEETY